MTNKRPVQKKRKVEDRLYKVERTLALRKPELKHSHVDIAETTLINNSIAYDEMTVIPQGDAEYERIGNEIKVMRIEVDLYTTTNGVDLYLHRPINISDVPDPAHFAAGVAHPMRSWSTNKMFTYRHTCTDADNNKIVKWQLNFPNGFTMKYNGSTSMSAPIYFTIANYSGGTAYVTGFTRIYYLDS